MSTQTEIIGKAYILHNKLGEGGMGEVYRATHRLTGRMVALKRVRAALAPAEEGSSAGTYKQDGSQGSTVLRISLAEEFQTLASLHHPHIVSVLDYGFDEQQDPYFTMELLSSPKTILEGARDQPLRAKAELLVQLLQALTYLHRRGILHRDIKPSNVLVEGDQVKLLDFGIADAIGASPRLAGTLEYMAPELFLGEMASPATDLYAVGVLAHELLTNRSPHSGAGVTNFLDDVLGDSADNTLAPDVADMLSIRPRADQTTQVNADAAHSLSDLSGLDESAGPVMAIITRLLARDPQERYQEAVAVIRDLSTAIGQPFPEETAELRESFLQAATFVGREKELKQLSSALAEIQRSRGSVIMVSGESGVGKTRLISELRTRALVRSVRVVRGQSQVERGNSYQLWSSVLREMCLDTEINDQELGILKDIVPDLELLTKRHGEKPAPVQPQAAQERLRRTIEALFLRQRKPLLVLLEDLQWAESESLELLDRLGGTVESVPVLIVGNYREEEATKALRQLKVHHSIRLERLGEEQIAQLCESMLGGAGRRPGLAAYLHKQTEGNVFFLVEVVRALAETAGKLSQVGTTDLPEYLLTGGIEHLVARRMQQIPSADRGLLDLAAVAGRRLDEPTMLAAAGVSDLTPWLTLCANTFILEAQAGLWQFVHDKMREWLLAQLDAPRKKQLHRQIAEAITAVYADDSAHDAALAHHWNQADVPEKAYVYYLKAAQAALRLFVVTEARAHYTSALAALGRLPDSPEICRQRIDALMALVNISIYSARLEQLMSYLTQAETLLDGLRENGEHSPADQERYYKLQFYKGRYYHISGFPHQSISHYEAARSLANKANNRAFSALVASVIIHPLSARGYIRQTEPYTKEALAFFQNASGGSDWIKLFSSIGVLHIFQGEVKKGFDTLEDALRKAKDPTTLMLCEANFILGYMATMEWANVYTHSQRFLTLAQSNNDENMLCVGRWFSAWAQAWMGQHGEAAESARIAHGLFEKRKKIITPAWFIAADADIALLSGNREEALLRCQESLKIADDGDDIFGANLAHRIWARAILAGSVPDWSAAANHIMESVQLAEKGGSMIEIAHSRMVWAAIARGQKKDELAAEQLRQAAEQYKKSGLDALYNQAEQELERLGPHAALPSAPGQ